MFLIEIPFEISRDFDVQSATNGMVEVKTDYPLAVIRRRRASNPGGTPREMVYVELPDGTKVYARQLITGHVSVIVTKREVYA